MSRGSRQRCKRAHLRQHSFQPPEARAEAKRALWDPDWSRGPPVTHPPSPLAGGPSSRLQGVQESPWGLRYFFFYSFRVYRAMSSLKTVHPSQNGNSAPSTYCPSAGSHRAVTAPLTLFPMLCSTPREYIYIKLQLAFSGIQLQVDRRGVRWTLV